MTPGFLKEFEGVGGRGFVVDGGTGDESAVVVEVDEKPLFLLGEPVPVGLP